MPKSFFWSGQRQRALKLYAVPQQKQNSISEDPLPGYPPQQSISLQCSQPQHPEWNNKKSYGIRYLH